MVATFLQQELADELKKIFEGFRLKNPQGEESELNICLLYTSDAADDR